MKVIHSVHGTGNVERKKATRAGHALDDENDFGKRFSKDFGNKLSSELKASEVHQQKIDIEIVDFYYISKEIHTVALDRKGQSQTRKWLSKGFQRLYR